MSDVAVLRAWELSPVVRQAVEDMLGRKLGEDEEVTVAARPVSPDEARLAAVARLDRVLDRAAENLRGIPDAEVEAAIDEAMDAVRRWET